MKRRKRFLITLWDATGAGRGRGARVGIIQDAESIQASEYVNSGFDLSFIIPYDHPQAANIVPYNTHFEYTRYDEDGNKKVLGVGLIDDYTSDKDTTTVHGSGYFNQLMVSISHGTGTTALQTYVSKFIENILIDQLTTAIAEPNSRLGFLTLGNIDSTSTSVPKVITAFQQRGLFIQNLLSIWQADQSVRPWLQITREPPFQISFQQNAGAEDLRDYPVNFGRNVANFLFKPGWRETKTSVSAVGWQRGSSDIFYSSQTYGDETTIGHAAFPALHYNVDDQSELDALAQHDVRLAFQTPKNINLQMREGVPPLDGWDLTDNIPVTIQRGPLVQLNNFLFTIVGWQHNVEKGGAERTLINTIPKQVQSPSHAIALIDSAWMTGSGVVTMSQSPAPGEVIVIAQVARNAGGFSAPTAPGLTFININTVTEANFNADDTGASLWIATVPASYPGGAVFTPHYGLNTTGTAIVVSRWQNLMGIINSSSVTAQSGAPSPATEEAAALASVHNGLMLFAYINDKLNTSAAQDGAMAVIPVAAEIDAVNPGTWFMLYRTLNGGEGNVQEAISVAAGQGGQLGYSIVQAIVT